MEPSLLLFYIYICRVIHKYMNVCIYIYMHRHTCNRWKSNLLKQLLLEPSLNPSHTVYATNNNSNKEYDINKNNSSKNNHNHSNSDILAGLPS